MIRTNRKVANSASESRLGIPPLKIPNTPQNTEFGISDTEFAKSSPVSPIDKPKPAPTKPTKPKKPIQPYIDPDFTPNPNSIYNTDTYLTPQQLKRQEKVFIKNLLKGMPTKEAAMIAGYPTDPEGLGMALIDNPRIRSTLESHWATVLHDEGIHMLNIVREIAHIALFDPRSIVDPETGLHIPLHKLPRHVAAAIESMEVEETEFNEVSTVTKVKYKFSNKLKALQQLGEHLGLFNQTQRVEVTGKDGAPIQMDVTMTETEMARRIAFVLQRAPDVVDVVAGEE